MAKRKKTSGGGISGILAFLFLLGIAGYLIPIILPYVVGAVVVVALIFVISKANDRSNAELTQSQSAREISNHPSANRIPRTADAQSQVPAMRDENMARQVQILKDCEEIVNESDNLDTVAYRYGLLIEKLEYFAAIPSYTLEANGIRFGKSASEYLSEVQSKKTAVICQAIERAGEKCREHIQALKTRQGKENAVQRFHDDTSKIIAEYNLPAVECLNQLEKVCQEIKNESLNTDERCENEEALRLVAIPELGDSSEVDIQYPYVSISTSGDERVCRMCKQFEGKLFRASEAPQLPLHPLCACAYMFHETPGRKKIRNPADFVLPAECTLAFCANSAEIMGEKDIHRRIQLCEEGLLMLKEFLAPYCSAKWNPPEVLPCVDWSIHDYMALGNWEKALQTTQICVEAGAFKAKDGESQILFIQKVSDASSSALEYLSRNPGTLQRNMYKKLCPPCDREALKWFLANSARIRKEKVDKTNRLYVEDC